MSMFLTDEQVSLAEEVGALLVERAENVSVAESSAGGLISAALLQVAGASRYYAGGGVVYTLKSRTALAGVSADEYVNYKGTTPEMLTSLGNAMRERLGSTWCVAESGIAGPSTGRYGAAAGRTTVAITGPVIRVQVFETGLGERDANMVEFTTLALRMLRDAIREAQTA